MVLLVLYHRVGRHVVSTWDHMVGCSQIERVGASNLLAPCLHILGTVYGQRGVF